MPMYITKEGEKLAHAQLPSKFPHTSWDWKNPVTEDLANHLELTIVSDPEISLEERQGRLLLELEHKRIEKQNAGLPYKFSNEQEGTIQTRFGHQDLAVINTLSFEALVRQMQNDKNPLTFRDLENINHPLSSEQMIDLNRAVNKFISQLGATKWSKQEEIKALTIDTIDSYDLSAGWPS